jgi:PPM family protein phosphatase
MTEDSLAAGSSPSQKLRIRITQRSDVGKVRSENQDFAVVSEAEEPKRALMIVADGMGGHRGGAAASRLASTAARDSFFSSEAPLDPPLALRKALEEGNRKVYSEAQSNPDLRGMGTTCSALAIVEDRAWFAHVGDSRVYLVREGRTHQLTEDHSLVATMVKEGLLTRAEAEVHPRRNVLQRSMGVGSEVEIDVSHPLDLQAGDTFVLCSDGLHGLVKEKEIAEIATLPLQQAASEYIRRALERGAPDNVTVIVARVEDPSSAHDEEEVPSEAVTAKLEPVVEQKTRPGIARWIVLALLILGIAGMSFYLWGAAPNQITVDSAAH